MERKGEGYVEWIYENLGCWKGEIHGNCLTYRYSPFNLYPRGFDGNGEHLIVQIFDPQDSSRIKLSFIGADGFLICKQEIQDPEWNDHWLTLPSGHKFQEVVQKRKNKNLQKDVLILRLHWSDNSVVIHGRTTIDVVDMCIKIPSNEFKYIEIDEDQVISDFSLMNGGKNYNWTLNARQKSDSVGDAKVFLSLHPAAENISFIRTRLSLLDGDDVTLKTEEDKHVFRDEKPWEFSSILKESETLKNGFCLDLSVKLISGDIRYDKNLFTSPVQFMQSKPLSPPEKEQGSTDVVPSNSPLTVLSEELMCLYQDQDFSDFRLNCDNVSFPVHRAVLSARSSVFKTMLSTDMKETASGCMDIEDLDVHTLGRFLAFLYTGAVEDMTCDSAFKLYYAADKYQVPTLKRECADYLCSNVSVSNVCDVLSLGDRHQDDRLTSEAHRFILKNFNRVLSSAKWKSFVTKEPLLGVKTLTYFAERNFVKESDSL